MLLNYIYTNTFVNNTKKKNRKICFSIFFFSKTAFSYRHSYARVVTWRVGV